MGGQRCMKPASFTEQKYATYEPLSHSADLLPNMSITHGTGYFLQLGGFASHTRCVRACACVSVRVYTCGRVFVQVCRQQ